MASQLVVVADGSGPAADSAGLAVVAGQAGEIGGDDADMGWQRRSGPGMAPDGEVAPVRGVRPEAEVDATMAYAQAEKAQATWKVRMPSVGSAESMGIRSCMGGLSLRGGGGGTGYRYSIALL